MVIKKIKPLIKKSLNGYLFTIALTCMNMSVLAQESIWYKDGDPLKTQIDNLPKIPDGYREPNTPCGNVDLNKPIYLAEVADTSLCNNPQTSEIWANTRIQAAQLGIAKSAYLPSLTDNVSGGLNISNP